MIAAIITAGGITGVSVKIGAATAMTTTAPF
jgi:hypothetical protein